MSGKDGEFKKKKPSAEEGQQQQEDVSGDTCCPFFMPYVPHTRGTPPTRQRVRALFLFLPFRSPLTVEAEVLCEPLSLNRHI